MSKYFDRYDAMWAGVAVAFGMGFLYFIQTQQPRKPSAPAPRSSLEQRVETDDTTSDASALDSSDYVHQKKY